MPRDDRLPPNDLDAEKALLGALLLCTSQKSLTWDVDEIRAIVGGPQAFYGPDHGAIYRAIVETLDAAQPVDWVSIVPRLCAEDDRPRDKWEQVVLALSEACADTANALYYARVIRDCWRKREAIRAANALIERAYDPTSAPDDIVGEHLNRLDAIEVVGRADHEPRTETEVLHSLDSPQEAAADKIPVALGQLSAELAGGFDRGTLTVIGARPATGKTSLGLTLCSHATRATGGCSCLFVSCEMTEGQIGLRILSMRANVPVRRLRRGDIDDAEFNTMRNKAAAEAESRRPLLILDGTAGQDARAIAAQIRRAVRLHGVGLTVVDYLQLLTLSGGDYDRAVRRYGAISKLFKATALETNSAVILLSQLNRACETNNRLPRLSDLRESGEIEEDADLIILLHKGKDLDGALCDTTFLIAKQRQGDVGKVTVCYRRSTMTYEAKYYGPEPDTYPRVAAPETVGRWLDAEVGR